MFNVGDHVIYTDSRGDHTSIIYNVYDGYYDILLPERNVPLEMLLKNRDTEVKVNNNDLRPLGIVTEKYKLPFFKNEIAFYVKRNNKYLCIVRSIDMAGQSAQIEIILRDIK